MEKKISAHKYSKNEPDRDTIINNILLQTCILRQTILFVDLHAKRIIIRNYNPDLYSVFGTEEMEYDIEERKIAQFVCPDERALFNQIEALLCEYSSKYKKSDSLYYFTYTLPFRKNDGSRQMILFKAMPVYTPIESGYRMLQFGYCLLEPSDSDVTGTITLYIYRDKKRYHFLLLQRNSTPEYIILDDTELSIFRLASRGYMELEIAELLQISLGTLKYLKNKILLQSKVQTTAQLIALLTKQGFI